MLQGIYRLESEPKSDDIDCYEALHDCDTDSLVIEDYLFADNDGVPNNPSLPLIVYRGALKTAGDVVVIPAGVAHKNEGASSDLLFVGAYPRGQRPDMCRPGAADDNRALVRIAAVPLPAGDPLFGPSGPLLERWRSEYRG